MVLSAPCPFVSIRVASFPLLGHVADADDYITFIHLQRHVSTSGADGCSLGRLVLMLGAAHAPALSVHHASPLLLLPTTQDRMDPGDLYQVCLRHKLSLDCHGATSISSSVLSPVGTTR